MPEELGGGSVSGDGVADLALIAEQIGQTVAPGPLHPVSVVLAGLVDAEDADRHAETIESLVSGELGRVWAVYEPGRPWAPLHAGSSPPRRRTPATASTASRTGSRPAPRAACCWWSPNCDGSLRQFLVPTDAAGVTVEPQRSLDLVKRYARVQFDGVEVDESAVVGSAGQTAAVIARQRQIALVLQCAETVGILDAVLAMTVQWVFDRHCFGRPLASYQALKHRFADMKMWFEACRATTAGAVAGGRRPVADDADLGQRRESLCGRTRPGDAAGLCSAARRYRRDLGTRPAPVPAAGRAVPRDVRLPGGTPPSGVRTEPRSWSPPHDRDDDRGHQTESVGFRSPGPHLAGREHAAHRSGQPPVHRARR